MLLKAFIPFVLALNLTFITARAGEDHFGNRGITIYRATGQEEKPPGRLSTSTDPGTGTDTAYLRVRDSREKYDAAGFSGDSIEKAKALVNSGMAYCAQYRYNLAMESYLEAKRIAESADSQQLTALVYHAIGKLHLDMRNTELARNFLTRALRIREKYGKNEETSLTLNSLALVLWLQGELDSALNYLFSTLEIEESLDNPDGIARACNNIGIVYHEKKEYDSALTYLFRALEISERQHDLWTTAEASNNIGEVSISMNNFRQAETYLAKARTIAKQIDATLLLADNYHYVSRLFKRTGQYEKALEYYEMFTGLNDSLFNRNTYTIISELTSLFEIEKREQSMLVQEQKIEILEAKRRNDHLLSIILAVVIIFLVTTALLIITRQRRIEARNRLLIEKDRVIKETQARLMENEKAEKERLEQELENKNKFLIDFALYIGMKNEFLLSISNEIRKSAKKAGNTQDFKHLLWQISQNLRHNRDLVNLQQNVEQVNVEFIRKLMTKYPTLTENEKQLAILLRLNFSTKEIADLRAVSIKGVEMSRYRLRKKMELDDKENLSLFFRSI